MFFRVKENKIYDFADYKYENDCLFTELCTMSEYQKTPNKYIVSDVEAEIDVPDYETILEEYEVPICYEIEHEVLDENGMVIETYFTQEISGYETKTKEKTVQSGSHKETIIVKGLILNPNFEAEEAQKEAERIAMLSLTKREVFLALYQDKGISPEQIRSQITETSALIEFDYAEKYYRGNPLIDMLGQALGYTKEQLDYLFIHKVFSNGI